MLILALIGATWIVSCMMAVALCVMAKRGDAAMDVALATVSVAQPIQDVGFVATFAEPVAAPAAAPQRVTRGAAVPR
jgi:hypothetical protein